jgi:hypothetical protein
MQILLQRRGRLHCSIVQPALRQRKPAKPQFHRRVSPAVRKALDTLGTVVSSYSGRLHQQPAPLCHHWLHANTRRFACSQARLQGGQDALERDPHERMYLAEAND